MKPKSGDRVRVSTKDESFEGVLLPRPDVLSQDIVVLKLDSGYNIGIESVKIKKLDVLESFKLVIKKKLSLKKRKDLPTVAILSTGGTISSRIDYRTGGVSADYGADDFVSMCPELLDVANIETVNVMELMSEDASSSDWVKMAKAVVDVLSGVDGVVITHGTDTMHFSSAALSFLLNDLNKPVVITGAQRSIDRGSSDAFMNLICAVTAAAKWDGAGVVTCMHGSIDDSFCDLIRGTKVRKMHTSRRDAFRAVNDVPLARVFPDGKIDVLNSDYRKRTTDNLKPITINKLDSSVALVYVYPNFDPGIFDYHIKQGVKAFVVAATALGHVPLHGDFSVVDVLKKVVKKCPVFITSQTLYGSVNPFVYTNLRIVSMDIGAVYLGDLLPEVAYVKAMVALKQKSPVDFMLSNVAGEFIVREKDSFLI